jgi:hypothetical protein
MGWIAFHDNDIWRNIEACPVQNHLGSRWLGNHRDLSAVRAENSGATLQESQAWAEAEKASAWDPRRHT